jgi:hypothetical protein
MILQFEGGGRSRRRIIGHYQFSGHVEVPLSNSEANGPAGRATRKKKKEAEPRRHNRAASIEQLLSSTLSAAVRRRGFADERIISDWERIVGSAVARRCRPLKIIHGRGRYGTLHVSASGGAALELQHLAPQMIERVNAYFGYPAVGRLQIIQAPPPPRPVALKPVREPVADEAAAERDTGSVENDGLREALRSLHLTLQRKNITAKKGTR